MENISFLEKEINLGENYSKCSKISKKTFMYTKKIFFHHEISKGIFGDYCGIIAKRNNLINKCQIINKYLDDC